MTVSASTQASPAVRVITARAVGFVLAGVALFDGAGLVYGGDSAVQTPSWAVFRAFPGPEAMGLIYIATALILVYALARPGILLAWVLSGGFCLYLVVGGSFIASWAVTDGQIVWPALSKPWGLAAIWLLVLLAKPISLPAPEASQHGQE